MSLSIASEGPDEADVVVVLAPGDCGTLLDPAPTLLARVWSEAGVRVLRFAAPPTGDDAALKDRIRSAAAQAPGRLLLAGLSRGARCSVELAEELGAVGVIAFAYPFHPRTDPAVGDRVQRLADCPVPVLMFQGTRDSHGNRQQVLGYELPAHVEVCWLEHANHDLVPRPRSGQTRDEQLHHAAVRSLVFIRGRGAPG